MSIEAMKRVVAAFDDPKGMPELCNAIDDMRQAIEQAEQQEPVAWMASDDATAIETSQPCAELLHEWIPLYTAPPRQPEQAQPVAWADFVETACALIKAADDAAADRDYMLDSDDCISVLRGTWPHPLANDCPTTPPPRQPEQAELEATERQVNILSDALAESRKINAELLEALRLIRDVSGGAAVAIAEATIAKHSKEQA